MPLFNYLRKIYMNIINLTPHNVVYIGDDGTSKVFKASGDIARVEQFLFAIPGSEYNLKTTVPSCVVGLPEKDVNTIYIVSAMVREAEPERDDLWSPTEYVRDNDGNIVGCSAFIVN